jgi:hypothetical protein
MGAKSGRTDKAVEATKKCRTDRLHYGVCASTADVHDNYSKTGNKIRGGGVCWVNVYETWWQQPGGEMEGTLSRSGET